MLRLNRTYKTLGLRKRPDTDSRLDRQLSPNYFSNPRHERLRGGGSRGLIPRTLEAKIPPNDPHAIDRGY